MKSNTKIEKKCSNIFVRCALLFLVFWLPFSSLGQEAKWLNTYPFQPGEEIRYKLNFGWFTIGKARASLDLNLQEYQGISCFKMLLVGGSSGMLNAFTTIKDEWGTYIKEDDLTPLFAYRNIQEGKYELQEQVYIDQDSGKIRVETYKPSRKKKRRPTKNYKYDTKSKVYDMLSGLLTVRTLDFNHMKAGDTVSLEAFFEDTFYDFKIAYVGKEELKTKVGKLKAHKVIPLMPENSVFNGKQSLVAWFSDDQNQIPLKVSANMFIGKASCEIVSYQNLKYGVDSKQ